jgi:P27 family predicted phage terminase small subunit
MGARGRLPQNAPASLDLVVKERPRPPKKMPKRAKDTWKQITNSLPVDHFRQSDLPLLEKYCMADHIYWDAMDKVLDRGDLAIVTEKGYSLPDIYLTIANKQAQIMTALSVKLRVSPNSRISYMKAGFEKEEGKKSKRGGLMFGG